MGVFQPGVNAACRAIKREPVNEILARPPNARAIAVELQDGCNRSPRESCQRRHASIPFANQRYNPARAEAQCRDDTAVRRYSSGKRPGNRCRCVAAYVVDIALNGHCAAVSGTHPSAFVDASGGRRTARTYLEPSELIVGRQRVRRERHRGASKNRRKCDAYRLHLLPPALENDKRCPRTQTRKEIFRKCRIAAPSIRRAAGLTDRAAPNRTRSACAPSLAPALRYQLCIEVTRGLPIILLRSNRPQQVVHCRLDLAPRIERVIGGSLVAHRQAIGRWLVKHKLQNQLAGPQAGLECRKFHRTFAE